MEGDKRGSHTVWDCNYHLVWVTKHRYQVLGDDVDNRRRQSLREMTAAHEIVIHVGSVNRGHIHMLVSALLSLSVTRAARTSCEVSLRCCVSVIGGSTCGMGYWIAASGNHTDDIWVEYIKNQQPPDPDDNFKMT